MPSSKVRETERELRTDEALGELSGEGEKTGVKGLKTGIYGAEGDPWMYKVDESGSVMVKSGKGDWLPAPSAGLSSIEAQIKGGQLKLESETGDYPAGEEGVVQKAGDDLVRHIAGPADEGAPPNPFDLAAGFDPEEARMSAAKNALKEG